MRNLFDISLIKGGKTFEAVEGVYIDQLVSVIDNHVEKVDNYNERVEAEYSLIFRSEYWNMSLND